MRCQNCHATVPVGAKFCISCGEPVPPAATSTLQATNQVSTETKAMHLSPDNIVGEQVDVPSSGSLAQTSMASVNRSKLMRFVQGSYDRSAGMLGQIIPPSQTTRRVNPYLAAGLELFGVIGILGLGRLYAGDTAGGLKTLVLWLGTYLGYFAVFSLAGLLAVLGVFFTFGLSLLVFAALAVPTMIPLFIVPIHSVTKLFLALK